MKFLIIGLGSMGKRRIRNLLANKEENIVGFDLSAEKRAEVEEKYKVQTIFEIPEGLWSSIDAVIISTPPDKHGMFIRLAIEKKKNFFVEATTSDDAYDEAIAARATGLICAPSCTMRYYEPIVQIKKLLDAGAIGKILTFQYHMGQYLPDWHPWEDYRQVYFAKKETGACREMFPFELHWLNWVVGASIEEISGYITKISVLDMDADDIVAVNGKYTNGVYGNILIEVLARKAVRAIRFIGTEGVLEWDWMKSWLAVYTPDKAEPTVHTIHLGTSETGYVTAEEMYIQEIKHFLEALKGEKPYSYTFEEDRQNLKTLYALEEATKTKKYINV